MIWNWRLGICVSMVWGWRAARHDAPAKPYIGKRRQLRAGCARVLGKHTLDDFVDKKGTCGMAQAAGKRLTVN